MSGSDDKNNFQHELVGRGLNMGNWVKQGSLLNTFRLAIAKRVACFFFFSEQARRIKNNSAKKTYGILRQKTLGPWSMQKELKHKLIVVPGQ